MACPVLIPRSFYYKSLLRLYHTKNIIAITINSVPALRPPSGPAARPRLVAAPPPPPHVGHPPRVPARDRPRVHRPPRLAPAAPVRVTLRVPRRAAPEPQAGKGDRRSRTCGPWIDTRRRRLTVLQRGRSRVHPVRRRRRRVGRCQRVHRVRPRRQMRRGGCQLQRVRRPRPRHGASLCVRHAMD